MNEEQPTGQKQHYIPVFFLKQWRGDDRMICKFTKPRPRVTVAKRVPPRRTGYEPGLYTFPGLPPGLANYLENRFFYLTDSTAATLLRQMVNNRVLPDDNPGRTVWGRFLLTLMHRNPEAVRRMRENLGGDINANIEDFRPQYEEVCARHENPPTLEQFIAGLNDADYELIALHCMRRQMDSRLVGEQLINMTWGLMHLRPRGHPRFLTCDRPMIMHRGLGQPDSYLVMPISPLVLFIAANNRQTIQQIERTSWEDHFIYRTNDVLVRQARRLVWGYDDWDTGFVANRLGEMRQWCPWE